MNIAVIGCGYVAEFYAKAFPNYPQLQLLGAYDRNGANLERFARRWSTSRYGSIEELTADPHVDLVLNLTNPRSHYEVTKQCLEAGKHVYSEKPLAMTTQSANELVALAESRKLTLSSAPCSLLSETAQTLWKALRENAIGKVRLVYANFDDGMIAPRLSPWTWTNETGIHWPAKDEFEVGCTYVHAGYVLTWLAAFFGPALAATSFASCLIPDKGIEVERMAPDFSVACIEYADRVVARVTCGLVAPHDKSMTVVGDEGVLFVGNVRDDCGPVMLRTTKLKAWQAGIERRTRFLQEWLRARVPWSGGELLFQHKVPLVRIPAGEIAAAGKRVDFMRGPAETVDAIQAGRRPRLSAQLGAHIVELVEAIQNAQTLGTRKNLITTFPRIEPMPWAD